MYKRQREGFRRAEEKASASREAVNERINRSEKKPHVPSEEVRELFRKVAKAVHPDLATNEQERAYRTTLMARANAAYRQGDKQALERILEEWEHRDEASFFEPARPSVATQLEQKIAQVRSRLREIEARIAELKGTELHKLMIRVEYANQQGRDLLNDMAEDLQRQIAAARGLLDSLKEQ